MTLDHSITLDLAEERFQEFEERIETNIKAFIKEDLWTLYWTFTGLGGDFEELERELLSLIDTQRLHSSTTCAFVDEWTIYLYGNDDLSTSSTCRNLLHYIFTEFEGSKAILWIAERFGLSKEELKQEASPSHFFDWMVLWMSYRYPHLALFLFDQSISKRYLSLKDLPLKQVISYLPKFMLWGISDCLMTTQQRLITRKLAEGNNIRHISGTHDFPTKKMAHYFANSPKELDFDAAAWYGIILGMNGNDLIFKVFHKHFGQGTKNLRFIKMLVAFFSLPKHQVEAAELKQLLAYLQHYRDENGIFSMKDWTLNTLRRRSEQWYTEMDNLYLQSIARPFGYSGSNANLTEEWTGAAYQAFEVEEDHISYHIVQLTSLKELHEEGKVMRHCVGTYGSKCQQQGTSIWSLYQIHYGAKKKLATIEVSKLQNIVQVKGKLNSAPKRHHQELIRRWAEREGLTYL